MSSHRPFYHRHPETLSLAACYKGRHNRRVRIGLADMPTPMPVPAR
ncbi:hypothetical protein ACO2Q9_15980 [Variovorax sp. VNK109]|jgi:hypothetical protein